MGLFFNRGEHLTTEFHCEVFGYRFTKSLSDCSPFYFIIFIMKQHYIYIALKKKYEAEIAEARATLEIYFNDAVGIGEHPQMLEEMDNFVEKLASANDKLANLEITFGGYENQSQNL